MENKSLYNFIGKIALEFRLSLDNVCKLLGKSTDDKSKMKVYEEILSNTWDFDLQNAYDYLFNYETVNESSSSSSLAFSKALIYLKRYTKAQKENNQEELKLLKKELTRTDDAFKNITKDGIHTNLTEEEITIIAKYRLKYCISKTKMAERLNIKRDTLINNEKKITNAILKNKVTLLSDFFLDLDAKKHSISRK